MRSIRFRLGPRLGALACVLLAGAGASEEPAGRAVAQGRTPSVEEKSPIRPDADGPANLRFNFRDVPLDTVLDYLSEAAGFTVVREAAVEGRVDIVSMQPLNKEEAVALLNSVLNNRGYAAIRNERTLTIVRSEDAKQMDIPVRSGSTPESIPKTGEMVTQVIPVRHADVTQLLENLKPLLPSYAVANANESSNAIVLTDTQADVRRMVEIIRALDTSIAAISEMRVFPLIHANALDAADLINTLFELPPTPPAQPAANPRNAPRPRPGARGPFPPPAPAESAAKLAAVRVQAVGDERTNSVVVSAPEDSMPLIETILKEIDKEGIPTSEVRVFSLQYSNAGEMAQIVNDAFGQNAVTGSAGSAKTPRTPAKTTAKNKTGANKAARQSTTTVLAHAVADYRTNSVVVTAEWETMDQVTKMIEQLEANPARDQKVFIYKLKNAEAADVATVLQGMLAQPSASVSRPRPATSQAATSSSFRTPRAGSTSRRGQTSSRR